MEGFLTMQIRRHSLPALVTFWFLINILILFHMNKVWGRDWFHSVHLHMSVFRIHAFCLENWVCLFNVFQILWKCCMVWKPVQLVFLDLFYCEKVRVICSYLLWISPPPNNFWGFVGFNFPESCQPSICCGDNWFVSPTICRDIFKVVT